MNHSPPLPDAHLFSHDAMNTTFWLRIVAASVVCPYCSRHYVLAAGAGADHGH